MVLPTIRVVDKAEELAGLCGTSVDPLRPQLFKSHNPTNHYIATLTDGSLAGRCSIWVPAGPVWKELGAGIIGHFACHDIATGKALLEQACKELGARDCRLAIGPMDGNTWRSYRLVTDRGSEPPFFLEPTNPEHFPTTFFESGFTPMAQYFSALATDLLHREPRLEAVGQRLKEAGVAIRPLNLARFEEEASRIYDLSLVAFAQNFLYTPIERAEFLAQYAAVRPWVRPELCLLAEQDGHLVGYLFAVPDMLQSPRGQIDTVIVKTVAVTPGRTLAGLGSYLVEQAHLIAHGLGYRRAIHALMHESNKSRNLSAHYATTMRRYTLFSKHLVPEGSA